MSTVGMVTESWGLSAAAATEAAAVHYSLEDMQIVDSELAAAGTASA